MNNKILASQMIGLVKSDAPDDRIEEILDDFEHKVIQDYIEEVNAED